MGHFAKVRGGKVKRILVAESDFFDTFVDNEPGEWIQCSYNTRSGVHYSNLDEKIPSEDQSKALRKNYPGLEWTYDADRDAFYPPKPFDSWTLNETTCQWEAPITRPTIRDDQDNDPPQFAYVYYWDEELYQSDNTKGWVATKSSDNTIHDWNGSAWIAR